MKKTKTDRKLSLNVETLQNLTPEEIATVAGGVRDGGGVAELTKDKTEANCTYTTVRN